MRTAEKASDAGMADRHSRLRSWITPPGSSSWSKLKRRICSWRPGGTGLAAGVLYRIGLIGWVLRGLGIVVRGRHPERLPALGTSARVGLVAAVPGDRPRSPACRWSGRRAIAGLEGLVRPGHPVHGGHRLPGLHVHRPGAERGRTGLQGCPQPAQGPGPGIESGAVRQAGPRSLADLRHRGLDRRVRPAQPGPL